MQVECPGGDEYAAFWRARDAARITSINYDDQKKRLTIAISASEALDALTLRVDRSVVSVISPAAATLTPDTGGNLVLLPPMPAGGIVLVTLGYL